MASSEQVSSNIIISAPPFSQIDGKEGVDLALVCAAFDHQVNLIFIDDGLLHLVGEQKAQYYPGKMHDKQLKALEYYEIERIYADPSSLQRLGLQPHQLIDNVELVDPRFIQQLCESSQHTVTF